MDGWLILSWILERQDEVAWTGLIWLRIGTSGEISMNFGFHKMLGNYKMAIQLVAS
jgi:hypothetical protein